MRVNAENFFKSVVKEPEQFYIIHVFVTVLVRR